MPNIPPVVCTRSPISQLILNASNPSSNSLTVNFRPHKSPWPHLHRESSQTFLAAVNARLMLYSLLESEPFVFLVGPTSKRLTVHAALVKELSKPLDRLINNGAMKESNEKVAMLQYVSVETFSYFAEYCYTKNYRASPQNSAEGDVLDEDDINFVKAMRKKNFVKSYCRCHNRGYYTGSYISGGQLYCESCDLQKKSKDGTTSKLWNEFKDKKFGSIDLSHDDLRKHLDNMRPRDEIAADIIQHAKLFVFADQYLVQPLKDLCIHKLHRDLLEYDIEVNGVAEIADLLAYTYNNTPPELDGKGSGFELRDLVMTFAACKAEVLVDDAAFITMMEDGTEVSSAFARYLVKRLA
jgi:hypothetical protein